ncbi:MAG: hypothetical protein HOW97_03615 [Catenulispora sp.]|nr:hypothetical protein [Catenulispora sp.]NUR61010.1 hypothetical protein [Catenulispora sp.]
MTDPTPHPAAPPIRRAWQRAVLVFAVLVGFFLMHGVSAVGSAGCHGGMSPSLSAQSSHVMGSGMIAPVMAAGVVQSDPASTPAVTAEDKADESVVTGDSCIPLRPDGLSGLLLALGLCVAGLAWRLSGVARVIAGVRRGSAHGPPRSGTDLLCAMGVCRT